MTYAPAWKTILDALEIWSEHRKEYPMKRSAAISAPRAFPIHGKGRHLSSFPKHQPPHMTWALFLKQIKPTTEKHNDRGTIYAWNATNAASQLSTWDWIDIEWTKS